MWWGLWVNGELACVQRFSPSWEPSPTDFHLGFFSSADDYEVSPVAVFRWAEHLLP